MSIVSRIRRAAGRGPAPADRPARATDTLTDGAIDTLSSVLRVMGEEAFPIDNAADPRIFSDVCREYSIHVANGNPVPSAGIAACPSGTRQWARVRQFFADRRKAERKFVAERLDDYRGVVSDLVSGLRNLGERDQATEDSVLDSLTHIEEAVGTGILPEIREALSGAIHEVHETFTQQKRHYEEQLAELNSRMLSLRQDLVAAREEMQRDALTGAYNRRAFDASMLQSLNACFILDQPATLALIDLDNFKRVNDAYGHAAGDEVLRQVGECLARAFPRKGDFVARFGGDEFAVILNDTTADDSGLLVERFMQCVREIAVTTAQDGAAVSCSIGYTQLEAADCLKSAVTRADRALYAAKGEGRDRAVRLGDSPGIMPQAGPAPAECRL